MLIGGVPIPNIVLDHVDNYCMSNADTIINSKTYSQISHCNTNYKGGLRSDMGKVHFVPKDSVNEFLLYDFTVNMGDTLHNIYIEDGQGFGSLHDFIVYINSDSILINGIYRRRVYPDYGSQWIEGIGNTFGLFFEPWVNVSNYGLELHCMSQNDTTLYPNFSVGPCGLNLNTNEHYKNELNIQLNPNPASECITFTFSLLLSSGVIRILNLTSQTVIEKKNINVNAVTLDISDLPSGIYIGEVQQGQNIVRVQIVKI